MRKLDFAGSKEGIEAGIKMIVVVYSILTRMSEVAPPNACKVPSASLDSKAEQSVAPFSLLLMAEPHETQ